MKNKMIPRGGGRVERAQVGDPLELHFTILDLEVHTTIFFYSFSKSDIVMIIAELLLLLILIVLF